MTGFSPLILLLDAIVAVGVGYAMTPGKTVPGAALPNRAFHECQLMMRRTDLVN